MVRSPLKPPLHPKEAIEPPFNCPEPIGYNPPGWGDGGTLRLPLERCLLRLMLVASLLRSWRWRWPNNLQPPPPQPRTPTDTDGGGPAAVERSAAEVKSL